MWCEKGLFFLTGSFLMRMVGCSINDLCDRDIDKNTHRTKNRPLACGVLSVKIAILFLVIPMTGAGVLFLYLNPLSKAIALFGMILTIIYPLSKRFLKAPQMILGLSINMGVWIVWSELSGEISYVKNIMLLYGRGFFWTLLYDTVYAYQDIEDDKKNNVFSLAIVNDKYPKIWFFLYHLCMCVCDWNVWLFLIGLVLIILWAPHRSRLICRAMMCMGIL
jgi:4-hydroxybenzoate polyprenyl transferase